MGAIHEEASKVKQLDLLVSDFYLSGKKQQHGMKLACMGTLRWTCISSGWMHSSGLSGLH